ncbi:MAG: peptidoglycan D,D-transpeptidase FtsI family protein [Acutalibacteraceae bacterium]
MHKRGISIFIALCVLLSGVLFKIISLNYLPYADVGSAYSSKTLLIGQTRGNIYDCNLQKLVNKENKLVCAAKCGAYSLSYIGSLKDKEKAESLSAQLTKGLPVIFETDEKIQNDDMETFEVPERYEDSDFLCHVIGYTDSSGHGVSGIEKAYDTLLSQGSGSLSVTFQTDAKGRVLTGIVPTVKDDNFNSASGVILTIDEDIQQIAENAMKECEIDSGACVILSAEDAGISALVSTPTYSRDNLEKALKDNNSPLMNKALSAYAVGSVFKPIIAASALENKIETDFDYSCNGKTEINGTEYICNGQTSHGKMNLKSALEVSCNTYFVNLSKRLEADMIYKTCTDLGFSADTYLCDGISGEAGAFPEEEELENKGVKANISFGQGNFTATPLQMAASYLAIANGGYYKYPYLIKGTIDSTGNLIQTQKKPDSRVLSEQTCNILRSDLISTVENGNAYNAECSLCTVAGKTGTAQSGSYDESGKEILRTWFVGFFPANDPLYCVAILSENGQSGARDCAPVFSIIAEKAMELMINRAN